MTELGMTLRRNEDEILLMNEERDKEQQLASEEFEAMRNLIEDSKHKLEVSQVTIGRLGAELDTAHSVSEILE